MSVPMPEPLREGTVLDERFAVGPVLGRGGFGITYLVEDLSRGDRAVVNELAPIGSERDGDDLRFLALGPAASQRLRHQFTFEARRLQKVRIPRVPQFRAVFHEHQTAYFATDFIPGAIPLTELVSSGEVPYPVVLSLFESLAETLEAVHNQGLLHQDVRPSNILLAGSEAYLIDFGSARQWCADLTIAHEEQFHESAAIEQLSEKGRRTPATDLYGLGATTYTLLANGPPVSALGRLNGEPLVPLLELRPELPETFVRAIDSLLALEPADRPQSVGELKAILNKGDTMVPVASSVTDLDAKRRRLQRFRHDPKQCPACSEVLAFPEPLARDVCPVCQDGRIRHRRIEEMTCPSCRGGILQRIDNSNRSKFCPSCSIGRLRPRRGLVMRSKDYECSSCSFVLSESASGARDAAGNEKSWNEWRADSGRSTVVHYCDACNAQYDLLKDGRWLSMTRDLIGHEWNKLYPDEWAKIAAGLAPDAGNAYCESCHADFFVGDGCITLLSDPPNDPHGFASHYCGHLVPLNELPYLAVGKESGHKGLVCQHCHIEFDSQGIEHKLVRSGDARFRGYVGRSQTLKDWHRIAQDLPISGDESAIEQDISAALREAYEAGEIGFGEQDARLVWRGPAHEVLEGNLLSRVNRLTIDGESISYGPPWRKATELVRDVVGASAKDDVLTLSLMGGSTWAFKIDSVRVSYRLESGKGEVELDASSLANRLSAMTKRHRRKA